jgi:hypothetical protein
VDVLIHGIREHPFDPPGEARLHIALQPLVNLDVRGRLEAVTYVLSHHSREFDSDQLPALRCDPDWREL